MKKAFTLLLFVVAAVWQLVAQIPSTSPIPVVVRTVATDGTARVYDYGKPGFCDTLVQTVSGDIVLAYGLDSLGNETDSLVCDSMAADLTGKIALISRGTCEFGWKALRAQEAGAIGVFMYNRLWNGEIEGTTSGGPVGMGAGAVGAEVHIPTIMLSKEDGLAILDKINAGHTVTGFFEVRSFGGARTAYARQTPQESIKPLSDMGVTYINIDNSTVPSVAINAVITDPNGQTTSLSETLTDVAPISVNTVVFADSYTPSAVGTYNVKFTNSLTPDELEQSFVISNDHTFALDDGNLIANTNGTAELDSAGFVDGGFKFDIGNVYRTGPQPVTATHVTFVLGNHSELYTGDPGSDVLYINIRNADPDGNGNIPNPVALPTGYNGLNENGGQVLPIVATEYVLQETDQDFQYTTVELPNPVTLAANKIYLVTVEYDGSSAGTGIPPKFAFGGEAPPAGEVGSVVYYNDSLRVNSVAFFRKNFFLRLHLDGYATGTEDVLEDSKVTVSPVPASSKVNLDFDLDNMAAEVEVRILDFTGRLVSTRSLENVQKGRFGFDVSTMPTGTYFFSISTPEGFRSKKFQVMR
ncbi:MAG: T9SS type A sorting domain-containing protein [Saprospiraceae bacterium]|nr:T9SS type A sorting domain-containing protein [Saprospiraceae bacterium]